jgi:hypothetical protein
MVPLQIVNCLDEIIDGIVGIIGMMDQQVCFLYHLEEREMDEWDRPQGRSEWERLFRSFPIRGIGPMAKQDHLLSIVNFIPRHAGPAGAIRA